MRPGECLSEEGWAHQVAAGGRTTGRGAQGGPKELCSGGRRVSRVTPAGTRARAGQEEAEGWSTARAAGACWERATRPLSGGLRAHLGATAVMGVDARMATRPGGMRQPRRDESEALAQVQDCFGFSGRFSQRLADGGEYLIG